MRSFIDCDITPIRAPINVVHTTGASNVVVGDDNGGIRVFDIRSLRQSGGGRASAAIVFPAREQTEPITAFASHACRPSLVLATAADGVLLSALHSFITRTTEDCVTVFSSSTTTANLELTSLDAQVTSEHSDLNSLFLKVYSLKLRSSRRCYIVQRSTCERATCRSRASRTRTT